MEILNSMWIARDKDSRLFIYEDKPFRYNDIHWADYNGRPTEIGPDSFSITWEDEPVQVKITFKEVKAIS